MVGIARPIELGESYNCNFKNALYEMSYVRYTSHKELNHDISRLPLKESSILENSSGIEFSLSGRFLSYKIWYWLLLLNGIYKLLLEVFLNPLSSTDYIAKCSS